MARQLRATHEESVCDVCARSMLKGERLEAYVTPGGDRRLVCDLCRRRAEHGGWVREAVARELPPVVRGAERPRRGRLLGRRRGRPRRERRASGREEALDLPPPPALPGSPDAAPDPEGGPPEPPEEPDIEIAYEGSEPPARGPDRGEPRRPAREKRPRSSWRNPRHVRAVPANPGAKVEAALELFNRSEHSRAIAGIARSLGVPRVSAGASASKPSEVRLTVAWELSWYQYAVDLSDADDPIRVLGKGQEIAHLDGPAREWNAHCDEEGRLGPGLPG